MSGINVTAMQIHQFSRWKSADGRRWFIVLGKWRKGDSISQYEILEADKEEMKLIDASVFEQQVECGTLVRMRG